MHSSIHGQDTREQAVVRDFHWDGDATQRVSTIRINLWIAYLVRQWGRPVILHTGLH